MIMLLRFQVLLLVFEQASSRSTDAGGIGLRASPLGGGRPQPSGPGANAGRAADRRAHDPPAGGTPGKDPTLAVRFTSVAGMMSRLIVGPSKMRLMRVSR
jgi:hypothetical protein